jgi:hypothetical protein
MPRLGLKLCRQATSWKICPTPCTPPWAWPALPGSMGRRLTGQAVPSLSFFCQFCQEKPKVRRPAQCRRKPAATGAWKQVDGLIPATRSLAGLAQSTLEEGRERVILRSLRTYTFHLRAHCSHQNTQHHLSRCPEPTLSFALFSSLSQPSHSIMDDKSKQSKADKYAIHEAAREGKRKGTPMCSTPRLES